MAKEKVEDPILESNSKDENPPSYTHKEETDYGELDLESRGRHHVNAVFENPLAGIPREQLFKQVEEFCHQWGLMSDLETFKKGALVSQAPESATTLPELNDSEREALEREHTHKWSQPFQLYFLASESTTVIWGLSTTFPSQSSVVVYY